MDILQYLLVIIVALVGVDIFNGYRLGSKITGKTSEELQSLMTSTFGDITGTIGKATDATAKTQSVVNSKFDELLERLEHLENLAKATHVNDVTDAQTAIAKLLELYTKYQTAKASGSTTELDQVIADFKAASGEAEDLKKFAADLTAFAEEIKTKL